MCTYFIRNAHPFLSHRINQSFPPVQPSCSWSRQWQGQSEAACSTKWHTVANKCAWFSKSLTNLRHRHIGSVKQYKGLKAEDMWLYVMHKKKISEFCSTRLCLFELLNMPDIVKPKLALYSKSIIRAFYLVGLL